MAALKFGYTKIFKKEVEITTMIDNERTDVIAKNDWVSKYGYSSTELPNPYKNHFGMDIRASIGTNLYPLGTSKITEIGKTENDGNFLRYEWDGFRVTYRHLSKILVKTGQSINENTKIAESGDTGSTGSPHLHVDLLGLSSNKWYDPFDYIKSSEGEKVEYKKHAKIVYDLTKQKYPQNNKNWFMMEILEDRNIYIDYKCTKKDTGKLKKGEKQVSFYNGATSQGNKIHGFVSKNGKTYFYVYSTKI